MVSISKMLCHVPGRESSLRSMYASHRVPMEAPTDSRSEKFAIEIAQCQWTKCVWRSNNPSIVIDVRFLGDKDSSTLSDMFWNGTSFQQRPLRIKEELRTQTPGTPVGTNMEFRQGQEPNLFSWQRVRQTQSYTLS